MVKNITVFFAENLYKTVPNQNAQPGLTPNFLSIIAMGQKPVNADCNKFAPTKAVNHNQFSE
jgi:hypothetical protein